MNNTKNELTYSQIVATNALSILKGYNISVGNFEDALGFSAGYLSRAKRGNTAITINTAMEMATMLTNRTGEKVTFNTLLHRDYTTECRIRTLESKKQVLLLKLACIDDEIAKLKTATLDEPLTEEEAG